MQSFYSYYGSPLHLILEDEIAEACNRFVAEFIQAQVRYKEEHGVKWYPESPLWMNVSAEDSAAYDKVGKLIGQLVEMNGGGLNITEEMILSDIPWVKL